MKKFFVALTLLLTAALSADMSWNFAGKPCDWRSSRAKERTDTPDGLRIKTLKGTWLFSPQINLDASQNNILEVELKTAKDIGVYFYFRNPENAFSADKGIVQRIKGSGDFQTVRFDLRRLPTWKGVIDSFRLDPGTVEGNEVIIRSIRFSPAPPPAAPATAAVSAKSEWDFREGMHAWTVRRARKNSRTAEGLELQTGKNTWLFSPKINLDASQNNILEVELKTAKDIGVYCYFRNPENAFSADKGIVQRIKGSGDFQTVRFDLRRLPTWKGVIDSFRLDPGTVEGNEVIIRRVRFSKASSPVTPAAAALSTKTEWDFREGMHAWTVQRARKNSRTAEGLELVTENHTLFFSPALRLKAEDFVALDVEMRSEADGKLSMYFRNPDNGLAEARRINGVIRKSDDFRIVRLDLRGSSAWKGEIRQIRLDPGHTEGNRVIIRAIRFRKAQPGLLGNSTFADRRSSSDDRPDCWSGDIVVSGGGATVKAGGTACSDPVEIIDNEPLGFRIKGGKNGVVSVAFFDIFGKKLSTVPADALVDVPQDTAAFRVLITNPSSAPVEFREIIADFLPRPRPEWSGCWIWNRAVGTKVDRSALFVKEFEIADPSTLVCACLQGTADDWVDFSINGRDLRGDNAREWGNPDVFDIKPFLKPGKNELRAHVINAGGPGGLLAEIQLTDKEGRTTRIGTDGTFRSWALKSGEDWRKFDGGKVTPDEVYIVTRPGNWPWGKIPYRPVTPLRARLRIDNLPRSVSENSRGTMDVTLELDRDAGFLKNKQINFSLRLSNDRYHVFFYDTVLDGSRVGKTIRLREIPFDFRYLPEGEYRIIAEMDSVAIDCGGLALTMKRAAPVEMASVEIVDRDTIPKLRINGRETVFPDNHLSHMDRSVNNFRQIDNAAANGTRCIWLHYPSWKYKDDGRSFDFSSLDDMCTNIMVRNPDVFLLLCVYVDSVGVADMRRRWNPANRSELARLENGSTGIRNYSDSPEESPSMASPKYLDEGARVLTALYEHLKKQPYGARVIGMLPGSGLTWEWMYWGSQKGDYGDYSVPFQNAFRSWAMGRYGSLDAVNRAWKTSFPDEKSIVIPSMAARRSVDFGDLRRPAQVRYLIDFQEFFSDVVSDAVLHFTGAIKRASGGRLLAGAYYGYTNFLMISSQAHNNGHFALRRVLDSPDFDFQTAPSRYSDRGIGGAGGFMPPEASVALHGKLCITENDIRTVHSKNLLGKVHTLRGSRAVLEREAAMCMVSGGTVRWFDFSQGWINGDKRLAAVGGNIVKVREILSGEKIRNIDPENSTAVISSECATWYTSMSSSLNAQLVNMAYPQLFRTGGGFDSYLLEDLGRIPSYRSWLFLNALRLTDPQRKAMENLKKDGNLLIFTYGTDVIADDAVHADAMSKMLGFPVRMARDFPHRKASVSINGVQARYGFSGKVDPVFVAEESEGLEILGRFPDGTPALVRKKTPQCTVVFSSVPGIPAPILRELLNDHGVRIYNPCDGDVTWAAGRVFGVHTLSGGRRTFPAPGSKLVKELLSGRKFPVENGTFHADLPEESTSIFLLEK